MRERARGAMMETRTLLLSLAMGVASVGLIGIGGANFFAEQEAPWPPVERLPVPKETLVRSRPSSLPLTPLPQTLVRAARNSASVPSNDFTVGV